MFRDIHSALSYLHHTVSILEIVAEGYPDQIGDKLKIRSSGYSGNLSNDLRRRVQKLSKYLDILAQRRDSVRDNPEDQQKVGLSVSLFCLFYLTLHPSFLAHIVSPRCPVMLCAALCCSVL